MRRWTIHRLGTRRALLVDLPRPMTATMGFMPIRTRAPARVADGQFQAILAHVFEPRRLSLDHEVERFTHVQPGRLRRGQQTRRSTGG